MQFDDADNYLNKASEHVDKAISILADDDDTGIYDAAWHARSELECFTIILALKLEDVVEKLEMLKRVRVSSKDKKKDVLLASARNLLNSSTEAFGKNDFEDALRHSWRAKEMLAALVRLIESER